MCTDDRDADDLLMFGLDWVVREAVKHGMHTVTAWSMGSLNPATRYARDSDIGGLAPARRADIVLLNDDLVPQNTWYGGELVVENRKVTPILEKALSKPYRYPRAAYQTVKIAPKLLANNNMCFVTVIERHGKSGKVAYGLLKDFGLKAGAVGSSVGHDAHNIILAGTNEADLQLALKTIKSMRGGVCVVLAGKVVAKVALPIAGLLSEKRATVVAKESALLKTAWTDAGCALPYMGFNLIPLSVIPEIRITDKGLVTVPGMQILPLFE